VYIQQKTTECRKHGAAIEKKKDFKSFYRNSAMIGNNFNKGLE
jgi:hypothetical protein